MKKWLRNSILFVLSAVVLFFDFTIVPLSSSAAEVDEEASYPIGEYNYSTFNQRLNQIRADYPEGKTWTNANYYPAGWYGCWAFANICADRIFGYSTPRNSWNVISISNVLPGDVITTGEHTMFVIGVSGDTITIAEGNYAGKIHWGRVLNKYSENFTVYHAPNWSSVVPWNEPIPQGHVMSESEGAGQTIPDGDYWICSKISYNYFLDIPGDNFNTKSGTNLETWIWDSSTSLDYLTPGKWDVFHFKYLNNGFYQITQYNTNLAIDVENASLNRGTNVQMWSVNNAYAQQWSIEKTDSGYKLRARCNNYYMDIDSGNHLNSTNVLTWEGHDGIMQKFSFIPYAPDEKPLENGIYSIQSSISKNCYLDVAGYPQEFTNKSNVQIYDKPDERFQIEYVGNGYYRIYEAISKYAVEVINEPYYLDKNKNVMLYTKNNSRGQFWKIKKNSDGTYYFINELSGYYMDVYNGSTEINTNVQLHPYNGSTAQRWIPYRVLQEDMVTVEDVVVSNDTTIVSPTVTVNVDNKMLNQNTDYTVDVTADIAKGTGMVTVTGKGNFIGTVTEDFKITIDEPNGKILGDVNNDNTVDVLDAAAVQKHASGISELNSDQLAAADVNGDGNVDVLDAADIQKFAAGIISEFKKKA